MSEQRTEKPTQRRLQKARKDGRFPVSREFVAAFQWAVFVALMIVMASKWIEFMARQTRPLLHMAFTDWDALRFTSVLRSLAAAHAGEWGVAAGVLFLIPIAVHLGSTGLGFSLGKIAPEFSRLNPAGKLRGLPSQNFGALMYTLLMIPVFGFLLWGFIKDHLYEYLALPRMSLMGALAETGAASKDILIKTVLVAAVLGAIDFARQKRSYMKQMRMTKQEVREEHKEMEGNPQIKAKIRRLQREMSRRRMMADVPKATAVIMNPTHFAVALKYHPESMVAPLVVAKGKDFLALRIRETAEQSKVPIVENPPLARALYAASEVGQEIPVELYKAVAEILAYIYRIMNGRG